MLCFCTKQVALVRDLEKAFLMMAIEDSHKDFLRFFVDKLPQSHNTRDCDLVFFKCHLVFGLSQSPFLLNAALRHHVKKYEGSG